MRTLPVPSPQQLADIQEIHGGRIGSTVARQKEFSFAIWDQLRQQQKAFSGIAAWSTERFDLGQGGEARYAEGMWVSGSFFQVLQVQPMLGRLIAESDDYRGCGVRGAVISNAFWQREFGGRSNVIGSKLSLDGHPFEILGVTPPSFYGLEVGRNFDVALPLCSEPVLHGEGAWTADSTTWWLAAIGRLNPGWSFKQASAQLAGIAPGIFAATLPAEYDAAARKDYLRFSLQAEPAATGASPLRKQYADPLWVLLSISGLVLLIACANLANLMLARAGARQREMALRLTLGASRLRLIRQLLAESLLLALSGAAIGIALAQGLGRVLIAYIGSTQDPVFLPTYPDLRVLSFTFGVALLTCVLFGVAPAIQAANADPGTVMKASGRGLTAGRERFLLRRGLIVSQVALSLVLLVAALLVCSHLQESAQSRCWISTGQCSRRRFRFFAAQGCYRESPGIQARTPGQGEEYAGCHFGGGNIDCSVERRWMERVHRYSERVDLTQAGVLQCSEHGIFSDAANPHDRGPGFQRKRYARFAACGDRQRAVRAELFPRL